MPQSDPNPLSPHNLRCTAFHEAGHAVAAHILNIAFERVFIVRNTSELQGQMRSIGEYTIGSVVRNFHLPNLAGQLEEARLNVIQALAGPISEGLAVNQRVAIGPDDGDLRTCHTILKFAYCKFTMNGSKADFDNADFMNKRSEMESVLRQAIADADQFVQNHQLQIIAIADRLLASGVLSFDEVASICEDIATTKGHAE